MVPGYVLIAILIIIVFTLTHENSRYTATASAIRQVWTGDCRLGCRPSMYSDGGVSGLSSLVAPPEAQNECRDCVCESCPCALIEDFLKKCRPATQLYTTSADAVSQYYNDFTKRFQEAFDHVSRVLECRTSCRRQAQLVASRSNFDSNENFTIIEAKKDEKQKSAPVPSVSGVAKQYGDEIANKLYELAAKLSTSQQPTPTPVKPPDPRQVKPPGPTQMKQSTSFQTMPPVPTQTKPPGKKPPAQDKSQPASQNKPPAGPQGKPPAASQTKSPSPPQVKKSPSSQMKASPSSQTTPSYTSSTVTKQSSTSSAAKPTPASPPSKSSDKSEEQTISKEKKKASKHKKAKKQKSEDTLKSDPSFVDNTRNCSKCVEQGKTCIGGCPSADTKRHKLGE